MLAISWSEFGSTGAWSIGVFQALFAGNGRRPDRLAFGPSPGPKVGLFGFDGFPGFVGAPGSWPGAHANSTRLTAQTNGADRFTEAPGMLTTSSPEGRTAVMQPTQQCRSGVQIDLIRTVLST